MKIYKYTYLLAFLIFGCLQPVYRKKGSKILQTVSHVDLKRYIGKWYEIYRLPNGFEDDDCKNVTATYELENGKIIVINTCLKANGKIKIAKGQAEVVDKTTNSKLRVTFQRPFYGAYWILELDEDYKWAIVGDNEGKYLWILSRTPYISSELEKELLNKVERLGFDSKDLVKTLRQD
jgi:apolipoprotein D and lipocalin family protein